MTTELTPRERAFLLDDVLAHIAPRETLAALTDAELLAMAPMTPTGPYVESDGLPKVY